MRYEFGEYLVDKTKRGIVDSNSLKEISGGAAPEGVPTLVDLRDAMGWNAVDITKSELVIEDRIIKGNIIVRSYRKKNLVGEKIPLLIFIHGGGFFGGSIQNVEQISRGFADKGDFEVISVGYRLAPENPFPAALLDIYNVTEYFATNHEVEHIDPSRIYICGDSAGGNLTITLSLLDHSYFKTSYISRIVTFYPVTNLTTNGEGEYWDVTQYPVNDEKIEEIVHNYISQFAASDVQVDNWYGAMLDRNNPLISPHFATNEQLKSLPPLKIILGEFDPLRLQVDAFVKRLIELDMDFEYSVYNGLVHAFLDKVGDYPQAEAGIVDAIEFLQS